MFFLLVGNECFCGNFLLYNFIKKFKKKNLGIFVFVLIFLQVGNECFCGNCIRLKVKKFICECRVKCKGSRVVCGGLWWILIYRNRRYCKICELFICLLVKYFFGNDFEGILKSCIIQYFNLQFLFLKKVSNIEIFLI